MNVSITIQRIDIDSSYRAGHFAALAILKLIITIILATYDNYEKNSKIEHCAHYIQSIIADTLLYICSHRSALQRFVGVDNNVC